MNNGVMHKPIGKLGLTIKEKNQLDQTLSWWCAYNGIINEVEQKWIKP